MIKFYPGEQDLANLHSNLLLYIASAADNLPVMCQALALGADKNWPNPDDRNRHPLHAAVLTVSLRHLTWIIPYLTKYNLVLGFGNSMRLSFTKRCQSERPRSKRQDTTTFGNKGRTHNASVFVFEVQSEPAY